MKSSSATSSFSFWSNITKWRAGAIDTTFTCGAFASRLR